MFSNHPQNGNALSADEVNSIMDVTEILNTIEKNLTLITIGDEFSTQAKLFRTLLPDYDWSKKDGNKTIRKYVNKYVKWESINSTSKKIKVTEIIEHPEHMDGRINNGGAHNMKYLPLIAPALLSYPYSKPITYNQIYHFVYGFSYELIFNPNMIYSDIINKLNQDDNVDINVSKCNSHMQQYMRILHDKLREITNSALNSLQRENALIYEDVYMVQALSSDLMNDTKAEVSDEITVKEFLYNIYENDNTISKIINHILFYKPDLSPFDSVCEMKLFDLVDKFSSKPENYRYDSSKYSDPIVVKKSPSPLGYEYEFIQNIQGIFLKRLNCTMREIHANSFKRQKLYNCMDFFFWLIGWNRVYKAIDIHIKKPSFTSPSFTKYSLNALLTILEPHIFKRIKTCIVNPRLVEKNKIQKQLAWGKPPTVLSSPNIDIPYLAQDPAVNLLHCKIFYLSDNEKYFLTKDSQEQE